MEERNNNQDDTMEINNDGDNVDESCDIEEEDSDYDDDQWYDLNNDTLKRLKQNDAPTITNLCIDLQDGGCFFNSIDWKEDGGCISNNTHLERLHINYRGRSYEQKYILGEEGENLPTRQQLQDFFSCIYQNRSIKNLSIVSICINDEFGSGLIEGLGGHPSLKTLGIGPGILGSIGCIAIGKVLAHPKSKLMVADLPNNHIDDEGLDVLCDALLGNSTMKKLSLCCNKNITSVGWRSLANVIHDSNCKLVNLDLRSCGLNDDGANILGTSLRDSPVKALDLRYNEPISSAGWQAFLNQLVHTSMKSLNINSNKIDDAGLVELANIGTVKFLNMYRSRSATPPGWRSFFNSLRIRGTQLKKLDISWNNIGNEGIQAVGSLISNMASLKTLDLSRMMYLNNNITSQGWVSFFNTLQGSSLNLVQLNLGNNSIDDQGIQLLVRFVSSMTSLKYLDLDDNQLVTPSGWWRALSGYLQSPNFRLERLDLDENNINDDTVIALTNTLSQNKTLKYLSLDDCADEDDNLSITERSWGAVSTLLCNKTSIMDTYNSNHTLQDIGCDPTDDLSSLLELNKNKDKAEVTRQKILHTHFSTNETSKLQEFLDMELQMMPAAIAWIVRPLPIGCEGTQVSELSLLYNLTRRLPDLFDSSAQKKPGEAKKKRYL